MTNAVCVWRRSVICGSNEFKVCWIGECKEAEGCRFVGRWSVRKGTEACGVYNFLLYSKQWYMVIRYITVC